MKTIFGILAIDFLNFDAENQHGVAHDGKWHIAAVEAKDSQALLWVIEEDIIFSILM